VRQSPFCCLDGITAKQILKAHHDSLKRLIQLLAISQHFESLL